MIGDRYRKNLHFWFSHHKTLCELYITTRHFDDSKGVNICASIAVITVLIARTNALHVHFTCLLIFLEYLLLVISLFN